MAIFVDPDVRISHDGDVAHMEAYIAASATNPNLLVAGGELIVPGRGLTETEARLYRSADAGATWSFIPLPNEVNGSWDNAAVGGVGETAHFLTSSYARGLTLYTTSDGGKTWSSAVIASAEGWDRPHIAIDTASSRFRGRIYVAGEGSDGMRVVTSTDGGRTFSAAVSACPSPKGFNSATTASPLVLSDGTLLVPCAPYPDFPARATWDAPEVSLVSSGDGGQTFGPRLPMGVIHRLLPRDMYAARVRGDVMMSGNFMQGPSFAVAPAGSRFADRIFAAWQEADPKHGSRILFSWSGNRGATWSPPTRVDGGAAPRGSEAALRQGVPMLAVNREGVAGVAWFDARHAADGKGYDVYFSASDDGGLTFLPAVRVSSATSIPARGANVVPAPLAAAPTPAGEIVVQLNSPFSQRATGGDYSTMVADAEGRFHPLWADARQGAWQLYTATVRVLDRRKVAALVQSAALEKAPRPCALEPGRVQLVFGAPEWDASRNQVDVPVRLRNASSQVIASPIRVRVSPELPKGSWTKLIPEPEAYVPSILDAASSAPGRSTTLVYPISSDAPLFPNGVTAPIPWRLRVLTPDFLELSIRAVAMSSDCTER